MKIDLKKAILRIKDGNSNVLTVKLGSGNLSFSEKRELTYVKNYGALDTLKSGDQQALEVNFDFVWEWLRASARALELTPQNLRYIFSGYGININGTYLFNSISPLRYDQNISPNYRLRPSGAQAWIGNGSTPDIYYASGPLTTVTGAYARNVAHYSSGTIYSGVMTVEYVDQTPYEGITPTVIEALKQMGAAAGWASVGTACEPYCVDLELEYDPQCAGVEKETILLPKFRYESLDHDTKAATITCSGKCLSTEAVITRG